VPDKIGRAPTLISPWEKGKKDNGPGTLVGGEKKESGEEEVGREIHRIQKFLNKKKGQ